MSALLRLLPLLLLALAAPAAAQATGDRLAAAQREGRVVIHAATDLDVVQPLIDDFEQRHPGIRVDYQDLNSNELNPRFLAEYAGGAGADVLWSSAMDLQIKLVNDGHAQPHRSAETAQLPAWAVWKDEAFATSLEPVGLVYNRELLAAHEVPHSHAELLHLLERQRERFRGRIATYDPERSGLGFMLHSQDVLANPVVFWSLAEAVGRVGVKTETSTAKMLERVSRGEIAIGYNVLGSYALRRAANDPSLGVVLPRDYTLVMSRIAFISRKARHPNAARLWIDYLLSPRGQQLLARNEGFFSVREDLADDTPAAELRQRLGSAFRPIPLGAGLLTYLDQAKRRHFLQRWRSTLRLD